jgi:hypothetical protein
MRRVRQQWPALNASPLIRRDISAIVKAIAPSRLGREISESRRHRLEVERAKS